MPAAGVGIGTPFGAIAPLGGGLDLDAYVTANNGYRIETSKPGCLTLGAPPAIASAKLTAAGGVFAVGTTISQANVAWRPTKTTVVGKDAILAPFNTRLETWSAGALSDHKPLHTGSGVTWWWVGRIDVIGGWRTIFGSGASWPTTGMWFGTFNTNTFLDVSTWTGGDIIYNTSTLTVTTGVVYCVVASFVYPGNYRVWINGAKYHDRNPSANPGNNDPSYQPWVGKSANSANGDFTVFDQAMVPILSDDAQIAVIGKALATVYAAQGAVWV